MRPREIVRVTAQNPPDMNDRAVGLARVRHFENCARGGLDYAAVSDLPAALGIEGRLGDDDRNVLAVLAAGSEHFGLALVVVIADESRRSAGAETDLRRSGVILAGGASALALLVHQAVEPGDIDADRPSIAQHVLGQIERKAVGVVELEGELARERVTAAMLDSREFRRRSVPARDRACRRSDLIRALGELEFSYASSFSSGYASPIASTTPSHAASQENSRGSQEASVASGRLIKPPQHVFAVGVAGHDSFGDEEAHRARMISDRAKRDVILCVLPVSRAVAELLSGTSSRCLSDDRLEQIDVVVAEHACPVPGPATPLRRAPSPSPYRRASSAAESARPPRRGCIE